MLQFGPRIHGRGPHRSIDGMYTIDFKKNTVSNYPLNSYVYSHRLVQNLKLIREVSLCCVGVYHTDQHAENIWVCKVQPQMGYLFHPPHNKVWVTLWKREWKYFKSLVPWKIWEKQYLYTMTRTLHSQSQKLWLPE